MVQKVFFSDTFLSISRQGHVGVLLTLSRIFFKFHRDIFITITTSTTAAATMLIAVYGRFCECLSNIPFDHLV